MAYGLPRVPLRAYVENDRFAYMDRLEQYLRNMQDESKRYDWDGNLRHVGGIALYGPVAPGYVVSEGERKPSTRYNLARVIVANLTQMSLGGTSWPEINVDGDEAAEQALRSWSRLMRMPTRLAEARNFGGAEGTACLSLGISRGRFRLDVHNPKHCTVLEWADRDEFIPAHVVKAYSYQRDVPDDEAQRMVTRTFWYVRVWTAELEAVWNEIPDALAKEPAWHETVKPTYELKHAFGFCPFYWAQNLPDSQELDGEGDYEGIEDKLDEINQLLSSTTKGARKNVDPTLVVHKEDDDEPMQKGSGAVIYSPQGAEYLELTGTSVTASRELLNELRQTVLEEAQCVVPREDKITGAAQSAAAMRILFRPMIARCNTLRDQYGPLIERILSDVLAIARRVRARDPYAVQMPDGTTMVQRDVVLPDLDPGAANLVTLRWPEYFAPTSQDIKDSVSTAKDASGGKQVISQRTAVDYTARLFGVADVDQEIAAIEDEADAEADRMGEQLEREAELMTARRGTPPPAGNAAAGAEGEEAAE